MAKVVLEENIPVDNIYRLYTADDWGFNTWALDFYNKRPVSAINLDHVKNEQEVWLYVNDQDLEKLHEKGVDWDRQYTRPNFKISRLNSKFLNPSKRKQTLGKIHLIHVY